MELYTAIFKLWSIAWFISVALIVFRTDSVDMFNEVFGMLIQPNLIGVLFSVILIYTLLPFTIPYSITNIIKGSNEN